MPLDGIAHEGAQAIGRNGIQLNILDFLGAAIGSLGGLRWQPPIANLLRGHG